MQLRATLSIRPFARRTPLTLLHRFEHALVHLLHFDLPLLVLLLLHLQQMHPLLEQGCLLLVLLLFPSHLFFQIVNLQELVGRAKLLVGGLICVEIRQRLVDRGDGVVEVDRPCISDLRVEHHRHVPAAALVTGCATRPPTRVVVSHRVIVNRKVP